MITENFLKENATIESYVYIADKFKSEIDLNKQRLEKIKQLLKQKQKQNDNQ